VTIVIKVGTQAILAGDGAPLARTLENLTAQIAGLIRGGHQVALVSSGAVGSGRHAARQRLGREYGKTTGEKQLLAALGQHELMRTYAELFAPHGIAVAQLLLTKQDFQTRQHYLNIARLLREVTSEKNILPVINENDSVSIEELMFTDNDELSGLIAAQMNADRLIILTSVDGVYDGHPDDAQSKKIDVIDPQKDTWPEAHAGKTAQGRGGMATKLGTARKMSELGITTHIASLKTDNVLTRLAAGERLGTTILPRARKSSLKKWMAFTGGAAQTGSITVNAKLAQMLRTGGKAMSLLPVGIDSIGGDFKKGDLIDILAPDGVKIGIGIARYGADRLRDYIGQKGKPEIIHYDHLHIRTGG
jgi:glutamate 5-kinase